MTRAQSLSSFLVLVAIATMFLSPLTLRAEESESRIDKLIRTITPQREDKLAATTALPAYLPDEFIIASAPRGMAVAMPGKSSLTSEVERQNAVSGQTYTVISPIFLGGGPDGGNTTYIRFYNFELRSSTFTINVVAYPGANIIGTATATVPSAASRQYSIADILTAAGVPLNLNGAVGAALYVRNPDVGVAYQNVIYNSNSRFFENMTQCGDTSLSDLNRTVINVHTSTIIGYPSSILFHNYSASDIPYRGFVVDSQTGALVSSSSYRFTARANTSYLIPMSAIQNAIGWAPGPSQFHANILFGTEFSTDTYRAIVGQMIYNEELQAYINMTQTCVVTH